CFRFQFLHTSKRIQHYFIPVGTYETRKEYGAALSSRNVKRNDRSLVTIRNQVNAFGIEGPGICAPVALCFRHVSDYDCLSSTKQPPEKPSIATFDPLRLPRLKLIVRERPGIPQIDYVRQSSSYRHVSRGH